MTRRRELLIALGAGAITAPLGSFAQHQPAKVARIGFLGPGSASNTATRLEGLRAGLRDLGYMEGKNLAIEFRWADGKTEQLSQLATELVRLRVDVIVTHGTAAPLAARQASQTVPIVMAAGGDPIAAGLVTSLSRPGGNVTGGTFFSADVSAKRIELLKQAVPRITRIATLLVPSTNADVPTTLKAMERTAASLKLQLPRFKVEGPKDYEGAFVEMAKNRIHAIVVPDFLPLNVNASAIARLALGHRFPSAGNQEFAEVGGMMSYGVDIVAMFRRSAYFVDRILKGTKPADLPIEQATKFELFVNQRTAKALGISISQPFLMRADKVIE